MSIFLTLADRTAGRVAAIVALAIVPAVASAQQAKTWPQHSRERPMAPVELAPPQKLPVAAPASAIVLFDGHDFAQWTDAEGKAARWHLVPGLAMEVSPGNGGIQTKQAFGDVRLHVEWASPKPAKGEDQDRGNSSVFLMGRYEVQVLDSYKSTTYADGQAASIYGQFPPRVNVSRPPGEWQSNDIEFHRPRFNADSSLASPARMTVRHNGVLVHDDVALLGPTSNGRRDRYEMHPDTLPIALQDHGHLVRFRNIWVVDSRQ
jgi:hypothetical protein